jgi:hypothetical protein
MCSGSVTVFLHPAQACSTVEIHLPKGNHVVIQCVGVHPGLSGKNSSVVLQVSEYLIHKLNRIVVSDNLLFMRAKILRQNMQQTVFNVNVELLLLFLIHIIEIKERSPGQTPPVIQRVQNFGRLVSQ